jgi:hypothetical protein
VIYSNVLRIFVKEILIIKTYIMARIKVRFNLGRGVNYMKWKVQYPNGVVEYHKPSEVQLLMVNCQLRNHKGVAQKIFDGANKTVCAWVLCEEIEIRKNTFAQFDLSGNRVKYNPRVKPNWVLNDEVVDNHYCKRIGSVDFGLYIY